MHFMLNEMNYNEILNEINGFQNDINIIKIEIINKTKLNEMNFSLT